VVALASNTTLFILLNNLDAWPTPFVTLDLPAMGIAATGTKRILHWSAEQDAPAIARETVSIDTSAGGGSTIHLRALPPNAFVVVEIPMAASTAPNPGTTTTRRWRLHGVWNSDGGVTAFPVIAPKDARNPERRQTRTTVDVSRALSAASSSGNVSIACLRVCFSSFAASPEAYAANVPELGFVSAKGGPPASVEWIVGTQATYAGYASRSPDERTFTCIDYNTQASSNVNAAFEAALVTAANVTTVAVDVRVGPGQEPDLELSSLVIVAETY
jgi:hypothetical protein